MGKFYAVANGRTPGVYNNWGDCKLQVNGYSGARFKSFATQEEAIAFANGGSQSSSGNHGGSTMYEDLAVRSNRQYTKRQRVSTDARVIYTDGSSLGNGSNRAKAGWGIYWGENDTRNSSGPVRSGEQTNNRGELSAIRNALDQISKDTQESGLKSYTIRSDSQYSRDALGKWADKWEQNGWKTSSGESVKNQDLIRASRDKISDLRYSGVDVQIEYVPAHSGHHGNEAADELARTAAYNSLA